MVWNSSVVFKVACLGFLFALGCKKPIVDSFEPLQGLNGEQKPELEMKPLHVQAYGSKGVSWELSAPSAQAYRTKNIMLAQELTVTLYENGQKSTTINADMGTVDTRTTEQKPAPSLQGLYPGDMYLDGHVVVVSTDGSKLTTDWLYFRSRENLVTSTAPVRVEREDSTTTGIGLEATPNLSSVKIFKQTVVIKGKDEE